MIRKHKNICTVISYIEHLFILVSVVTGYVSISILASLVGRREKKLYKNFWNYEVWIND